MKKLLLITLIYIAVPSFFVLNFYVEKNYVFKKNSNSLIYNNDVTIKVKQVSKNKIINIDLEEYVKGVVAGEMPISFNKEALKAQAVAARTYALRRIKDTNEYDVVDTTLNQVYLDDEAIRNNWKDNYDVYMSKLDEVVEETKGEYVSYNGYYADTLFFSTSVGNTENSEEIFGSKVDYLRSVPSMWDEDVSPLYEQVYSFSKNDFCNKLDLNNCNNIDVEILSQTSTGRIKSIKINNQTFTGSDTAYYLGIRSNYFTITTNDNNITVVTKGYGHGVGMSQYGAEGMGINGYTYLEILKHYYQGTEIKKL